MSVAETCGYSALQQKQSHDNKDKPQTAIMHVCSPQKEHDFTRFVFAQ
jgi:hypothetical protein